MSRPPGVLSWLTNVNTVQVLLHIASIAFLGVLYERNRELYEELYAREQAHLQSKDKKEKRLKLQFDETIAFSDHLIRLIVFWVNTLRELPRKHNGCKGMYMCRYRSKA